MNYLVISTLLSLNTHIIGVQLNSVLETAQATWSGDMLLLVDRYGYTEESFFTYSYSPIFLETGEVGGGVYGCD